MRGIQLPPTGCFRRGKLSDGKWTFYGNERKTNRLHDEIPLFISLIFIHSKPFWASPSRFLSIVLSLLLIRAHTRTCSHQILCMTNCAETLCWAVISNRRQHTGALLTQRCCKTALSPTPTHTTTHTCIHTCDCCHAHTKWIAEVETSCWETQEEGKEG